MNKKTDSTIITRENKTGIQLFFSSVNKVFFFFIGGMNRQEREYKGFRLVPAAG